MSGGGILAETKSADPSGHRRRQIAVIGGIAATVLGSDQVTKSLVVDHLSDHRVHLVGPFYLALSYNSGVAFSIGAGLSLPIVLIAAVIVASIVWLSRGVITTAAAVAVGLILGGAVGNLCDRLFRGHHGAVVDFLYSGFWPTFNLADTCIVIGSLVLVLTLWRTRAS